MSLYKAPLEHPMRVWVCMCIYVSTTNTREIESASELAIESYRGVPSRSMHSSTGRYSGVSWTIRENRR